MKKKINSIKNITRTKTPDAKKPRKIRIETINDESNSIYYDLLTPKYSQRNEQDLELLLKEIEFYKMQIKAEKNINKSLNKEISYFNEIQKLGENKTKDFKLLEEITLLDKLMFYFLIFWKNYNKIIIIIKIIMKIKLIKKIMKIILIKFV